MIVSKGLRSNGRERAMRRETNRMLVSDRSSSVHEISKCSRLVMICAIWEKFAVLCARFDNDSLMYVIRIVSSD